ncbi:hypothetical protein DICPUDRAFT_159619 [Dictyostelium purpureum]|uniref:Uncharacterized protein n=1 Tax=Dictyostelium purpureum TaxID=5786 RepID=F1A4J8_DICPU|nr:uncharacterized protein DICPUDRAFT_159619 [Dictyostelium purpureum]EGC28881.1 hypothetical protein DICPUDRAFT_159619 [Dictyostelium purpureum]|eukprot:XP_003294592.1 hypothetical protein DICPUDRAFT_159619 [Dictyostelium purpureum]
MITTTEIQMNKNYKHSKNHQKGKQKEKKQQQRQQEEEPQQIQLKEEKESTSPSPYVLKPALKPINRVNGGLCKKNCVTFNESLNQEYLIPALKKNRLK